MTYNIISLIPQQLRHLITYGIIGALSASVDFGVFSLLVYCGQRVILANVIGVNIGIAMSFCLNRSLNFKMTDRTGQRFVRFYIIGLIGLLISTTLLYMAVDVMSLDKLCSKLATIIVVALIQFFLNKNITFK